jgi:hypothetical protein
MRLIYVEDLGEVYIDHLNNKWSARKYSLEEAKELSKTMKESSNNYNCSNLTNCSNLIESHNCKDCHFLVKSIACKSCLYSDNLRNCIECSHCYNCNSCINCQDCKSVSNRAMYIKNTSMVTAYS